MKGLVAVRGEFFLDIDRHGLLATTACCDSMLPDTCLYHPVSTAASGHDWWLSRASVGDFGVIGC